MVHGFFICLSGLSGLYSSLALAVNLQSLECVQATFYSHTITEEAPERSKMEQRVLLDQCLRVHEMNRAISI